MSSRSKLAPPVILECPNEENTHVKCWQMKNYFVIICRLNLSQYDTIPEQEASLTT